MTGGGGTRIPDVPGDRAALLTDALAHHRAGRLAEAAEVYRRVLAAEPDDADALHLSGILAVQQGRFDAARDRLERLVGRLPDLPSAWHHLGMAYEGMRQFERAEIALRRATELDGGRAGSLAVLARVLVAAGNPSGAERVLRDAAEALPAEATLQAAHATLLLRLGRAGEAAAACRRALARSPSDAVSRAHLALACLMLGDVGTAMEQSARAVRMAPAEGVAQGARAASLRAAGRPRDALPHALALLRLDPENPFAWHDFANGLAGLDMAGAAPEMRDALRAYLARDDVEYGLVALAAGSLLAGARFLSEVVGSGTDADYDRLVSTPIPPGWLADPLLLALLERGIVKVAALERLATGIRAALLRRRPTEEGWLEITLALACQAFANEYVWLETPSETAAVAALEGRLADDPSPGPGDVALLACYRPLHGTSLADRLERLVGAPGWRAVGTLLARQLVEPREELRLRSAIPSLTPVAGNVVEAVRAQYEDNPFPRWTSLPPARPRPLRTVLGELFPHLDAGSLPSTDRPDVLIAGCGTGRQPLLCARRFEGARILAIDISRASLAYGMRMARRFGVEAIEFAQADIARLGSLHRRFDLIESFGVLHHMADPEAGLRVLRGLLRDGGVMMLGLYSEIARRHVVAARAEIARRGLGSDPSAIRAFRREILDGPLAERWPTVVGPDGSFWTLSECRDLLFHVEEHRFTLGAIRRLLERNDLEFIGFELYHPWERAAYVAEFPSDPDGLSLACWENYETDHPDTFADTYQLWARGKRPTDRRGNA